MYREHVILQQNYFKTYVVCTYKLSIFPSYIIIQHCYNNIFLQHSLNHNSHYNIMKYYRYANGILGCISEVVLAGELKLDFDVTTCLDCAHNVEPGIL